jgi:hypothetical protein
MTELSHQSNGAAFALSAWLTQRLPRIVRRPLERYRTRTGRCWRCGHPDHFSEGCPE